MLDRLTGMADAAIAAVDGEASVRAAAAGPLVAQLLAGADRVLGISVGKAAVRMHGGLRAVVPADRWAGGMVVSHDGAAVVGGGSHLVGGHPQPTLESVSAADALLGFLGEACLTADDLVVCNVSGGASTLIARPVPGLDLADLEAVNRSLLRSGLDIARMNAVRRMLSVPHNGGLLSAIAPATCVGLIVNDVLDAGLDVVGSGPTFPARDDAEEAAAVAGPLLEEPLRGRVLDAIGRPTTPGPVAGLVNLEVAGPGIARDAAARQGALLGLDCQVDTRPRQGPVAQVADDLAASVRRWRSEDRTGVCLIASGEVGVAVTGHGRGGRCQQLAWEMIRRLDGIDGAVFLGVATDGRDHEPGVGGAWGAGGSAEKLAATGLDWAEVGDANDAFRGLSALGQLLPERSTGTNVADLYLVGLARGGPRPARVRL